jgi:hypothetical protein
VNETVLALDPGRQKCGLALGRAGVILARAVVPTSGLAPAVEKLARQYRLDRVVVGTGTGSTEVRAALAGVPDLPPPEMVEEAGTTLEARRRYFRDHPPRGWRRLLPLTLQLPPEPYDDYVAELLLERALQASV